MKDLRIKSVKLSPGRVEIAAVETWAGDNEREWTLRCSEDPRPALPQAMTALEAEVRELLELPCGWAEGALTVSKVTWSWSESTGIQGAVITSKVRLECANTPLVLNTPHLPFDQYSPTGEQPVMPAKTQDKLSELEREVRAYLDGERAQGNLFDGKRAAAGEEGAAITDKPRAAGRRRGSSAISCQEQDGIYCIRPPRDGDSELVCVDG